MTYKTIFHIDDDDDDLDFFMEAVKRLSTDVSLFSFSEAHEAIRKITSGELVPDAVFLDLNMPIMNGQQFLLKLKEFNANHKIKVIILSTSSDPGTISRLKSQHSVDFMSKASSIKDLANLLRPYLI